MTFDNNVEIVKDYYDVAATVGQYGDGDQDLRIYIHIYAQSPNGIIANKSVLEEAAEKAADHIFDEGFNFE